MIPKLDLSALPEELRNNWHIVNTLRSDAMVAFARAAAGRHVFQTPDWTGKFDEASRAWCEANPIDPVWSSGRWPEGADAYPGNAEIERARRLIQQGQT